MWRDVEIEVLLLLEQGGFKASIDNSNGQIHEINRSARVFADPFKSEPTVHISLKVSPHSLIFNRVGINQPNTNDIVNKSLVEVEIVGPPREYSHLLQSIEDCGPRWGWGVPMAVPEICF